MLITLPTVEVTIDIPGTMVIGDKEYKRKLVVLNLRYSLESKSVVTEALMTFFTLKDEPVSDSKFIKPYGISMIANNEYYCDMRGQTICKVSDITNEESEAAAAEEAKEEYEKVFATMLEGIDYMLEFDWFFNVANTVPVVMNDMIKQFYLRAIEQNRFN